MKISSACWHIKGIYACKFVRLQKRVNCPTITYFSFIFLESIDTMCYNFRIVFLKVRMRYVRTQENSEPERLFYSAG